MKPNWPGMLSVVVMMVATHHSAGGQSEGLEWRPADGPSARERRAAELWWIEYRRELEPVRRDWTALARAIRRGRLDSLPKLCRQFSDSIESIDRSSLLEFDDPVLRLHLGRGLRALDHANVRCRRRMVFDLVHRLSLARSALLMVDRRFQRYR